MRERGKYFLGWGGGEGGEEGGIEIGGKESNEEQCSSPPFLLFSGENGADYES